MLSNFFFFEKRRLFKFNYIPKYTRLICWNYYSNLLSKFLYRQISSYVNTTHLLSPLKDYQNFDITSRFSLKIIITVFVTCSSTDFGVKFSDSRYWIFVFCSQVGRKLSEFPLIFLQFYFCAVPREQIETCQASSTPSVISELRRHSQKL